MATTHDTEVTNSATTIDAYCKVIDLFLKATREGLPVGNPQEVQILRNAWEGLGREVSFLRFLREELEAKKIPG